MLVRSAPTLVSNTLSKPSRRSAPAIRPSVSMPMGNSKFSPRAARTAGATCTTTNLSGSAIASFTSSHWGFSVSAPTGHTATHWPQLTQLAAARPFGDAGSMLASKPVPVAAMAETACILAHTLTQRLQRMHLLLSRTSTTEERSKGWMLLMGSSASSVKPYSWSRFCSSHWVERIQ